MNYIKILKITYWIKWHASFIYWETYFDYKTIYFSRKKIHTYAYYSNVSNIYSILILNREFYMPICLEYKITPQLFKSL